MTQPETERMLAAYPEMLTVEEVATVLRVNRRSVQRWASQGRFTAIGAGRTYRIPRADVLRWLVAGSIPAQPAAVAEGSTFNAGLADTPAFQYITVYVVPS